jgi:hypothetical protein
MSLLNNPTFNLSYELSAKACDLTHRQRTIGRQKAGKSNVQLNSWPWPVNRLPVSVGTCFRQRSLNCSTVPGP